MTANLLPPLGGGDGGGDEEKAPRRKKIWVKPASFSHRFSNETAELLSDQWGTVHQNLAQIDTSQVDSARQLSCWTILLFALAALAHVKDPEGECAEGLAHAWVQAALYGVEPEAGKPIEGAEGMTEEGLLLVWDPPQQEMVRLLRRVGTLAARMERVITVGEV